MRKKKRGMNILLTVVLAAVAAACFLYCLDSMAGHRDAELEYWQAEEEYVEAVTEPDGEERLEIDWDSLLAANPEIVGWICLNGDCSYPVARHDDNSYYLDHSAYGEYSVYGAIFMSYVNSPDWTDRNTVVYGHNMNNGSMFGSNKKYRDASYVRENPYFYVYTPDGRCRAYRIFSVMEVDDATRPYDTNIYSDADFAEYITDVAPLRLFDPGVEVTSGDSVVTLSTCAKHNTDRRLVIQGVYAGYAY